MDLHKHNINFSPHSALKNNMNVAMARIFLRKIRKNISVFSRPENCLSISDIVFISVGRVFHANGPATEKLRGPKPAVLVSGTTRSPCNDLPSASGDVYRDCQNRTDHRDEV